MGCLRLRGQTKSVDMVTFVLENKKMMRKWAQHMMALHGGIKCIADGLHISIDIKPPIVTLAASNAQ